MNSRIKTPSEYFIIGSKLSLLVLTFLTFMLPANHPNYSHLGGAENNYMPVPVKGFNTAFFQIGLHREIMRTIPESEWMYQDWYFTKEKIYGDANNFFEASINNPWVFITNLIEELPGFTMLAKHLIGGYQWAPPFRNNLDQ